MANPLFKMLEAGKVSTEQLVEAINRHPGRATADRDLIVVVTCDHCGDSFPSQPQDARKQAELKERTFCFKRECRQVLRRQQTADRRAQRKGNNSP
jgi:hypothetical protein